jgi:hypothetical protein
MRRAVSFTFLLLALLSSASCVTPTAQACPVTSPNGATFPGEQPSEMDYGHEELYTQLWTDGIVRLEPGGPGEIRPDGSLAMKFPWRRGEGVVGAFQIESRRLDGEAPPLRAEIPKGYGETGFQASLLIFPTQGCWEVTARVGQAQLTFVT